MEEKKVFSFYVEGRLPTLNEYIKAERGNRYAAAKLKKETEIRIVADIKKTGKGDIPIPFILKIVWYEKTKRRDKDNVAFAKKFILDALQKGGYIENDNNKNVKGFIDEYVYGESQGVLVRLED